MKKDIIIKIEMMEKMVLGLSNKKNMFYWYFLFLIFNIFDLYLDILEGIILIYIFYDI